MNSLEHSASKVRLLHYLGATIAQIDGTSQKRLGMIYRAVFTPDGARCVGFFVKRPDFLFVAHRGDAFVAFADLVHHKGIYTIPTSCVQNTPVFQDEDGNLGKHDYIVARGRDVCTQDGACLGSVKDVSFDLQGSTKSIYVSPDAAQKYLLGMVEVPYALCMGIKKQDGSDVVLVSDEVWSLQPEGGWAQDAAHFATKAKYIAQDAYKQASDIGKAGAQHAIKAGAKATSHVKEYLHETQSDREEVAKQAFSAVNKAAFATGKQIAKTKGIFSEFKAAYKQASGDVDGEKKDRDTSSE